jgi:hypothetical protein
MTFLLQATRSVRGVASLAGAGTHGQLAHDDSNGDIWINLKGSWFKISSAGVATQSAVVTNGQTVTLQKSDGTTSAGNATLNSPATINVSNLGVVTSVKASA